MKRRARLLPPLVLLVLVMLGGLGADARAQSGVGLFVGASSVELGERTRLSGTVAETDRRRRIIIESSEWPYHRWRVATRMRTDRRGNFAAVARPRRNTRYRVRTADGAQASIVVTVYADFPGRSTVRGGGGSRPRVRFTVGALPGAQVRRGEVFAYLSQAGGPYRLVDRRRWSRRTRRSVTATMRFPSGALGRRDRYLVCAREPEPDAFGRPSEQDRRCGEPEIPRDLPRYDEDGAWPGPWQFTVEGGPETLARGSYSMASPGYIEVAARRDTIRIDAGDWQVTFDAPAEQELRVGHYAEARRHPFNDRRPGLDLEGSNRGCNEVFGAFTIHELAWKGAYLRRLKATFEHKCGPLPGESSRGFLDYTGR